MTAARTAAEGLMLVAMLAALGCALPGPGILRDPSLRLTQVTGQGDPTRRASIGLVIEGLDADVQDDGRRARGLYARALQIDSGNPYAYLALARHYAEAGDVSRAREHLVRSQDLFEAYDLSSPRVDVHLTGLRGVLMRLEGRSADADPLLASAARTAPSVWGDGRLTAAELR